MTTPIQNNRFTKGNTTFEIVAEKENKLTNLYRGCTTQYLCVKVGKKGLTQRLYMVAGTKTEVNTHTYQQYHFGFTKLNELNSKVEAAIKNGWVEDANEAPKASTKKATVPTNPKKSSYVPVFDKWLNTFVSEKELNTDHDFNIEGHIGLTLQVVLEHIKATTKAEQKQIQDIIVKIDFANGDVMHFFNHLAKGLAAQYAF